MSNKRLVGHEHQFNEDARSLAVSEQLACLAVVIQTSEVGEHAGESSGQHGVVLGLVALLVKYPGRDVQGGLVE